MVELLLYCGVCKKPRYFRVVVGGGVCTVCGHVASGEI